MICGDHSASAACTSTTFSSPCSALCLIRPVVELVSLSGQLFEDTTRVSGARRASCIPTHIRFGRRETSSAVSLTMNLAPRVSPCKPRLCASGRAKSALALRKETALQHRASEAALFGGLGAACACRGEVLVVIEMLNAFNALSEAQPAPHLAPGALARSRPRSAQAWRELRAATEGGNFQREQREQCAASG